MSESLSFPTVKAFKQHFSTEKRCRDYLVDLRWGKGIVCPHCGNKTVYIFSDSLIYKCSACRRQFTLKTGTRFAGTKVPFRKWFVAIFRFLHEGPEITSTGLGKELGLTQKTAWYMKDTIRAVLMESFPEKFPSPSESTGSKSARSQLSFVKALRCFVTPPKQMVSEIPLRTRTHKTESGRFYTNYPTGVFDPEVD